MGKQRGRGHSGLVHAWYYVRERTQRRLHLGDLACVLGDEVIVLGQPLGRQGEHVAHFWWMYRRPFGLVVGICRRRHVGRRRFKTFADGKVAEHCNGLFCCSLLVACPSLVCRETLLGL